MKRTVHLGWLHLGYFLHRSPELSFDMSLTRQGATLGVHLVWLGLWACVTSPEICTEDPCCETDMCTMPTRPTPPASPRESDVIQEATSRLRKTERAIKAVNEQIHSWNRPRLLWIRPGVPYGQATRLLDRITQEVASIREGLERNGGVRDE